MKIKLTDVICTIAIILIAIFELATQPQAKPVEPVEEITEIHTEPETVEELKEPVKEYKLCSVAIDEELQKWIIDYCEDINIDPYLIMAMCERESSCNSNAIGDNGKSYGLMQIQARYHEERINRLDCHNLLNPKENIIVGIDILQELYNTGNTTDWVLMAYNGGRSYANRMAGNDKVSDYAEYIMLRCVELKNEDKNGVKK